MYNINKKNFFDALKVKYPDVIQKFCDWVDKYKEEVGWNNLFGGDMVKSPKFHELPYEMQYGIMLRFFNDNRKMSTNDVTSAMKFFEDMFIHLHNGTSYYDYHSPGVSMIDMERRQHVTKHGYDDDHDKGENDGELINCAVYLLTGESSYFPKNWPLELKEKMSAKTEIEKQVVAGSMIAANIDRLKYAEIIDNDLSSGHNNNTTGQAVAPK